jgi:hypothetical protein
LLGGKYRQPSEDEVATALLPEGQELDVHPGRPRQKPTRPTGPAFESVRGRRQQMGDVFLARGVRERRLSFTAEQPTSAVGPQARGLLEGPVDEQDTPSAVEEENGVLCALEEGLPPSLPPRGLAHGQK